MPWNWCEISENRVFLHSQFHHQCQSHFFKNKKLVSANLALYLFWWHFEGLHACSQYPKMFAKRYVWYLCQENSKSFKENACFFLFFFYGCRDLTIFDFYYRNECDIRVTWHHEWNEIICGIFCMTVSAFSRLF